MQYDFQFKLSTWVLQGQEHRVREEYLRELEVSKGDRVLEISIGTGAHLRLLPPTASYFGLDGSWGMLKRCRDNLRKWDVEARLYQGLPEALPFRDAVFDAVFHVGGVNLFGDRARAIGEMVRVTRPGGRVVIVDETEKKSAVSAAFAGPGAISIPSDLVPVDMEEARVREICGGELYYLSFRKPC